MNNLTNKAIVDSWSEYIDWEKRAKGENNFFSDVLKKYNCKRVFDAGLGDGFDSIQLIKKGFEVVSNEIDSNFREKAVENAKKLGLNLGIIQSYYWTAIPNSLKNSFDSVVCLGNSLVYLLTEDEQKKAVSNFRKIVKPGGIVITDHRNYDYILDERKHILKDPKQNFRFSKKFYYCGKDIDCYPVKIEDDEVVHEYTIPSSNKKVHLDVFPVRRQEMITLMNSCGLKVIESYGDFILNKTGDVDFYQHVGIKV